MPQGHFVELTPGLMVPRPTKVLPIQTGQTAILRGSIIVEEAGEWRIAAADSTDRGTSTVPGKILHWALQDQDSQDVAMAGGLAALPCTWPMTFETDQFSGSPAVGDYLMSGAGVLAPHTDGLTAVAVVEKVATNRWVNDRLANHGTYGGAQRTGASVSVIQARTVFLPSLSIS